MTSRNQRQMALIAKQGGKIMSYCRYCGREIMYTRTANDKWMPYDVTGEPHFCNENSKTQADSGLEVCSTCGKPVFKLKGKYIDYTSLELHQCKKGDITRYKNYKEKKNLKSSQNRQKTKITKK